MRNRFFFYIDRNAPLKERTAFGIDFRPEEVLKLENINFLMRALPKVHKQKKHATSNENKAKKTIVYRAMWS